MSGATFLLVHGAFHGSWCWHKLVPLLEARGHVADAIDLPYPQDPRADAETLLDIWTSHVAARVRAHGGQVIIVGHSRAGLIISQVAERIPEQVGMLVYCAAMLVGDGETMADARTRLGTAAATPLNLTCAEDGISLVADPIAVAEMIYSRSAREDIAWATARLRAEPPAGFRIAPRLTQARYGSVRKAAVECLNDRVMSIAFQRAMRDSQPCDLVLTLDCDHAPHVSAPQALSEALDTIARSCA